MQIVMFVNKTLHVDNKKRFLCRRKFITDYQVLRDCCFNYSLISSTLLNFEQNNFNPTILILTMEIGANRVGVVTEWFKYQLLVVGFVRLIIYLSDVYSNTSDVRCDDKGNNRICI